MSQPASKGPHIDLTGLSKVVNSAYWPLFRHRGRYALVYGGSGSGKSWAIAQKSIMRMFTDSAFTLLCVRKTGNTIHESQFALLRDTIRTWNMADLFVIKEGRGQEEIVCKLNSNRIIFAGLDDVEKLKSIHGISSIWIEEASEVEEADFLELNRRLRGYQGTNRDGSAKYMQIILSLNPVSILHWTKRRFVDDPQRKKDTLVLRTTYLDNKWIDQSYKEQLEELGRHEDTMYDYLVYAKGEWGIVGGGFFSSKAINERIIALADEKPLRVGQFEYDYDGLKISNIRWVDDDNGLIKIYQDPEQGVPYVCGGDTAGEGSDWNRLHCINNVSGEQIAVLSHQHDEDVFARQAYCLGMHYNTALIGLEVNFSTHPTKELERLGYPKQYVREQSPDAFTMTMSEKFGYRTQPNNRMDMLGVLRSIVREHPERINDLDTLHEMSSFVKDEKGRPAAAQGAHDDLVMSLAITYAIRDQQDRHVKPTTFDLSKLPKDVRRDYQKADTETRKRMLVKWGYIKDGEGSAS